MKYWNGTRANMRSKNDVLNLTLSSSELTPEYFNSISRIGCNRQQEMKYTLFLCIVFIAAWANAINHSGDEDTNNNNSQKKTFVSLLKITDKKPDNQKGKSLLKRKAPETKNGNAEDPQSIQNSKIRPRYRTISEIMAEDPLEGTSQEVKVFGSKRRINGRNRLTLDHSYSDENKNYQITKEKKPMVVTTFILENIKRLQSAGCNESADTNSTETAEEDGTPTDELQTDADTSQVYEDKNYNNNNNLKRVKHFIYGASIPKNLKQKSTSEEISTKSRSSTKNEPERLITSVHKNDTMHIQKNSTIQAYEKPLIGRNMDEAVPYYESRPGQHFEGSNPYKLEPANPPTYAKEHSSNINGPDCENVDKVLAELENYNVYIERPIWRPYTFDTGTYNREELKIDKVVAEKKFYLDKQIIEWKSLRHHAIGRGNHGLSLVTSHADGVHIDNQDLSSPALALDMFQWWDLKESKMNTGVLIVQGSYINWHSLNDENRLTKLWSWSLTYPIVHVAIFNLDGSWKVAVTHEQVGEYKRAVSIYGLDLWKNWWFEDKLRGHGKPAIINNGRLLGVTLENHETILVYKYDYNLRRYSNFKTFKSPGIESLVAFIIGSHSFLAVGGDNPYIYEVKGSEFVEKIVHHYKLEHVEQWLPISLGYYRNDAIVLFQHKLDHYTHSSSVLEALQWDGEKFYLLEHSPCLSHEEEMFGFSCILDAEGEKGVKGATSLHTFDDNVNILTASEEYTPIMFKIQTKLIEVPDPIDQEVEEILAHKRHLEERFVSQQRIIEKAEKILNDDNNQNGVISADNWKIEKIIAPSVHIDGNFQDTFSEGSYMNIAGQDWRNIDYAMDTTQMFDQIRRDHDKIKDMVNILKKARMKKDGLPDSLKDVTITGNVVVHGNVKVNNAQIEYLNGLHVNTVLEDTVKKSKDGKLVIDGDVILESLSTDNINVEQINGINILEPNKNHLKNIKIEGDLEIENHIHILKDVILEEHGTVNKINFKTDIYTPRDDSFIDESKLYPLSFDNIIVRDTLTVENTMNGYDFSEKGFKKLLEESRMYDKSLLREDLTLETLSIGKDINFENINGRFWKDFIERTVMTDEEVTLDKLNVDGMVKIGKSIEMAALNNLAYPNDYFLMNGNNSAVFMAPKTFVNVLKVDEIDCEGVINGVKPENLVTLSTRQRLDNFTFFDLTVTENFNVQGNITGKELDAFLSNPHLSEVKEIKSNVIFRNLRVNGTVIVENKINGSNWNSLFEGVIMKTNKVTTIDSLKSFEGLVNIENGLNVRSGFVNNRRVADFFTVDTDQMISNDIINGNIAIEELDVEGMFDGVNVTHLNDNVATLSDDQTLMSDVTFDDDFDYSDEVEYNDARTFPLEVSNMIVNKFCNNWPVPDGTLFHNQKSLELSSPEFDNLYVDQLIIEGNLLTNNLISGIDLFEFDSIRLSKTRNKNIVAPYTIKNCTMNSVEFETLNDITKHDVLTFKDKLDNIDKVIEYGDVNIGTLHIDGKLNASKINGVDLRLVAENAIWLKDDNYIPGHIKFVDKVFAKNLQLKNNAHNVNFQSFIDDVVRISDDPIKLKGVKVYTNGLDVINVTTDFINGMNICNILTVHGDQSIAGKVHIGGNLAVVKNLYVDGAINEISIDNVENSFEYLGEGEYLLKGNFHMENDTFINNLIIEGLVNDVYDLKNILQTVTNKESENYFENTITFTEPVILKSGLNIVKTYNNVNFQELLENIMFKNDELYINSSVVFKYPLTIEGEFNIEGNMFCDNIQYCSVDEWKSNAIFLNEVANITGVKQFKNLTIKGNVKVNKLNNIPIDKFVTLHSDQKIIDGLNFKSVTIQNGILVNGYVNSKRLDEEFKNTLLNNGDQYVESPINFHSNVFVKEEAHIDLINGKNVDNIVNLDSDEMLEGSYSFYGASIFEGELNLLDTISEIDLNLWMKNALFKNEYGNKIIGGTWNVLGSVEFQNVITGTPKINGITVDDFDDYLQRKNYLSSMSENYFNTTLVQFCNSFNYIKNVINKKLYLFNYLEEVQTISSMELTALHYFTYSKNNYIVINNKWECDGYLWRWNKSIYKFEKLNRIKTGCPKNWHTLTLNNRLILISISDVECDCKLTGTTIWTFDGMHLRPIKTLALVESVSVPLRDGEIFYTLTKDKIHRYSIKYYEGNFEITEMTTFPRPDKASRFIKTNHKALNTVVTDGRQVITYSKLGTSAILQTTNERLGTAEEIFEFDVGRRTKTISAVVWSRVTEKNYTEGAITIYEDVVSGVELQRFSCYKPSSLTIVQLHNYQTLLVFVENNARVRVYTYHGFEGFKHLYDLDIPADKIEVVELSLQDGEFMKGLVLISDGVVSIVKIVMHGKHNADMNIQCTH
ncbi:female sterile (1) Nasrat [Arctopsyche grandis]|uniref:female sterile (1) Nasrat n=1 Tax=Arctopsyche grandis TaxID=121162 RepID=UPI00406D99B9